MTQPGTLKLRLPRSLLDDLRRVAAADGVSMNQLVLDAVARRVGRGVPVTDAVSGGQIGKLHVLMEKLAKLSDTSKKTLHEQGLAAVGIAFGHEVASMTRLTREEASWWIDELEEEIGRCSTPSASTAQR